LAIAASSPSIVVSFLSWGDDVAPQSPNTLPTFASKRSNGM
jgi:hypothetical protein